GAGPVPHPPRRVPRGAAGDRWRRRQAARISGAGAAARDEYDGVESERRRDHAGRHRHEGRAGAVPGAAGEPGVTPQVVVLSAPSGGGKTTISRTLLERYPDRFAYSVSATTRRPRPGEEDGKAYRFLTRPEFQRRREAAEFGRRIDIAVEEITAAQEDREAKIFDRLVENADLETAIAEVVETVREARRAWPRTSHMEALLLELIRGLRSERAARTP